MKYHMSAFFFGFLLDLLLGDPHCLPHPIRLIGSLIGGLERKLLDGQTEKDRKKELKKGVLLVFLVLFITLGVTAGFIVWAYCRNCYDLSDFGNQMPEGGEYEGLLLLADRRAGSGKKGCFYDCGQRYVCFR